MKTNSRRRWIPEEKLAIIEEARQTPATISEVCRRHGLATGRFYAWEKLARQGALQHLRDGNRKKSDATTHYCRPRSNASGP